MKVLLDTHSLFWFLLDDPKLSSLAKTCIEAAENEVFVSPASYWEIAIKISLGKYQLTEPLNVFMQRELAENDFSILPITPDHAGQVAHLPFHHRDPFDRLIIAQSLVEAIPTVSADVAFDVYGIQRIW